MGAIRLEREHYAAFTAPSARESRRAARDRVLPELRRVSDALVPGLSQLAGQALHLHLSVEGNKEGPVREAIAAFCISARRFRDHPCFTLAVSRAGVQVRVMLGSEARDGKMRLAERLEREGPSLAKRFRTMAGLRCYNDLRPEASGEDGDIALDERFWKALASHLRSPQGGLDIGFGWSASRARTLAQIEIMTAFERLAPIFRLMDEAH
jgi:uncharacterized protein YktB (UPF0637 family)